MAEHTPAAGPAVPAPLQMLLSRHSLGGKHLVEPGPDDAALRLMVQAALRAPDHAGLTPFRFKVVRNEARLAMAALFERVALQSGKAAPEARIDAERASRPPVTVAVVARIDMGHPLVPAHEQWASVGGAIANFLNAAHALGFAGKMLSGHKVRQPPIQAAFCEAGETLVGWISLGTPAREPSAGHPKAGVGEVLTEWWMPKG